MGPEIFRLNFEIELKHWWFRARREILRKLIAQVAPPSPDTLLVDIGCGTGANIGALAEDYACVGIGPFSPGHSLGPEPLPRGPLSLRDVARRFGLRTTKGQAVSVQRRARTRGGRSRAAGSVHRSRRARNLVLDHRPGR